MTGELWTQLVGGILFFLTVSGVLWGVWWRIEGKVDRAKADAVSTASVAIAKADMVMNQLADHRLHVAETYITKAGMREVKDEILGAVSGIKDDLGRLNERIDRMHESQSKARPTRAL